MTEAGRRRMGRPRAEREPASELGRMVLAAMEARGTREGRLYTLRLLAVAAGLHWGYVARVIRGLREPSRESVLAIARALVPDLDVDEALVAAGYTPDDPRLLLALRRLIAGPRHHLTEVETVIAAWAEGRQDDE